MIQVNRIDINQVYVIGPKANLDNIEQKVVKLLSTINPSYEETWNWDMRDMGHIMDQNHIPTDGIKINEENVEQQLEALYPILNKLDVALGGPKLGKGSENARDVDPNTVLFVVDSQDKAGTALARLLEKQWGGYPFAAQTIVV